jgi:hypothetical protein
MFICSEIYLKSNGVDIRDDIPNTNNSVTLTSYPYSNKFSVTPLRRSHTKRNEPFHHDGGVAY